MSAATWLHATAPCTEGPALRIRLSCRCGATWWCSEEGLALATEMKERHEAQCWELARR